MNADSSVTFAVTRPLDCGIESSYVVQLDTELSLITVWNPDNPELSFHDKNALEFTQTLDSDGTCASDPTPTPIENTSCTQTLNDGGLMTVNYDSTSEQMVMNATIPIGSYAALGWGASMVNTEMVLFSADTDSTKSSVSTYYS